MMPSVVGAPHIPVLLEQVIESLAPRPGGVYCDATVGFGGHTRAILDASAPDGRVIGIDRDSETLAATREALRSYGDRLTLVHAPFSKIASVLQGLGVTLDGCLADLGVSSAQLDRPERGFSFMHAGPLDMRMDRTAGLTVADYLRTVSADELEAVLRDFGEERYARRIAGNIIEARATTSLDSTAALSALVARSVPRREAHKNPATRTFQALRIAVNGELRELEQFLADAPGCLVPGGRLVMIAFHSLEDRLVKHRFRALAGITRQRWGQPQMPVPSKPETVSMKLLTKRIVVADDNEREQNPRARSAKLRAAERVAL